MFSHNDVVAISIFGSVAQYACNAWVPWTHAMKHCCTSAPHCNLCSVCAARWMQHVMYIVVGGLTAGRAVTVWSTAVTQPVPCLVCPRCACLVDHVITMNAATRIFGQVH